jgi:hypothetical protein
MTIEITRAEVEALIRQRLRSGAFSNAEGVILDARSSEPIHPTGADLIAALQASPCKDIDVEPSRSRPSVRDAAL